MVQCKKNGTTATDEDKTAQREARNGLAPNKHLLKARILFDGGYYQRAYNYLTTEAPNRYDAPMLQIEYYYRLCPNL